MDAYYILKINKFDKEKKSYTIAQQMGLKNYCDDVPIVSFKEKINLKIDDYEYIKYELITESKKKQRGRAYGNHNIFNCFIAINENCFYYPINDDIIILHCSNDIFTQFYKIFRENTEFKFDKLNVDFEYIIKNQNLIEGVEGIWLGQIDDINIRSLLLLGSKVEDSNKYIELKNAGAVISNMTIIYNYNNEQKKIMITQDGGIILYKNENETDALNLIKNTYKNLMS